MQVTPEQGQFLAQLALLINAQNYLEIGVFTGYSSLAVALALPKSGRVVALERDESVITVAGKFWAQAGVEDKIDLRLGLAQESLAAVASDYGRGSFDLAFAGAGPSSLVRHAWMLCA